MSIQSTRFVRKLLFVDAIRVTEENLEEVARWCSSDVRSDPNPDGSETKYVKVRVLHPKNERQTKAFVGDWVLYAGTSYKVYTNKAFENTFDLAPVTSKV